MIKNKIISLGNYIFLLFVIGLEGPSPAGSLTNSQSQPSHESSEGDLGT